MSKRIVVFNHKGGVSKTTSVYNIGWKLAENKKVLIVDADPQCNLSSLVLGDDFEQYYSDEETKFHNIKDGVAVAFEGKPKEITYVDCKTPLRNKNVYLLAGHANLSEYDASLTFAQTSNNAITTLQNLPGAFSDLIQKTENKLEIDYTLIDLNPSLSAINQNLFLNSDSFLLPTNPDPFSVMAINTLTQILPRWIAWKQNAQEIFKDSAYPLKDGIPRFLGTLIQRFNIRNGKAAKPYRNNIDEIQNTVSNKFFPTLEKAGMTLPQTDYPIEIQKTGYCLGEIPDFQGLLPKSHTAGVPVFALRDEELSATGTVLTQLKTSRNRFNKLFDDITSQIVHLTENE